MSRTQEDDINFIKAVLQDHKDFWDEQMPLLRRYRDAYENKFWTGINAVDDGMIRVETSDTFAYIEGFLASLFSKAPSVVVSEGTSTSGDAELSQEAANHFLYSQREQLEGASRLSLIYPSSFFKFSPNERSTDLLNKVSLRSIPCWDIIIDRDATKWGEQRFTGHRYYLPLPQAREKFGNKQYDPVGKKNYFDGDTKKEITQLPDEYLYIEIVELYDLIHDTLYFWSPNWKNGSTILDSQPIPIRTYDDQPMTPIVPLYYTRRPDKPLEGISAITRIYDQCTEKNIMRTYWANSVRRNSRQYIYKEGAFDEDQLAKISAGIDGAMIATDEQSLAGLITPVPSTPISTDFNRYLDAIESDINRGSVLAPFTRGEATKATATEVIALAQYSASEIGKLARERDNAIEMLATTYIRIISLLSEDDEKSVINVKGENRVLSATDLTGDFKVYALDQGSQPLSDALRKNNLMQLIPILTSLGVDPTQIKDEVIRLFEMPDSFKEVPPPPEPVNIAANKSPGGDELGLGPTEQQSDAELVAADIAGRAPGIGI